MMFDHNRTKQERRKQRARQKNIQRAVFWGLLLLVIAFIIWVFVSGGSNNTSEPAEATPSKVIPTAASTKGYTSAPPMLIDISKQYSATVQMVKGGEFTIQLFADKAPITVNSFVFLARNGFYDNVTFHRVLDGFMAQAGDPTGTGGGGPGYQFVNELNDLEFDQPGVVAMANAGKNTNGSQFFITFNAVGLQESDYTIFGQVVSGMDVVNAITRRDPNQFPDFPGDAIQTITIMEQ